MFLLDTNVVSELRKIRRGRADVRVAAWQRDVAMSECFISAITVMELEIGVLRLMRRDGAQAVILRDWLDTVVYRQFADRNLPVDFDVARRCAALQEARTLPERDALIAATALVHGLTVVSRNVADFAGTGAVLLNPWDDPAA